MIFSFIFNLPIDTIVLPSNGQMLMQTIMYFWSADYVNDLNYDWMSSKCPIITKPYKNGMSSSNECITGLVCVLRQIQSLHELCLPAVWKWWNVLSNRRDVLLSMSWVFLIWIKMRTLRRYLYAFNWRHSIEKLVSVRPGIEQLNFGQTPLFGSISSLTINFISTSS